VAGILNQAEIDALLEAVTQGEPAAKGAGPLGPDGKPSSAKPYDFLSQGSLSAAHRKLIGGIHEDFARRLARSISLLLGISADAKATRIEIVTFQELREALPKPCTLLTLGVEEMGGRGLLVVHPMIGWVAVDRLLGGLGSAYAMQRPFTEIEQRCIDDTCATVLKELSGAWEQVMPCAFPVQEAISDPEMARLVLPRDRLVIATWEVKVKDVTGLIQVAYPYAILDNVAELAGAIEPGTDESEPHLAQFRESMKQALEGVPVEASAELGQVKLTVREVLALREGDILLLDHPVFDGMSLSVGKRPRFQGFLGKHGDKMAFAIEKKL